MYKNAFKIMLRFQYVASILIILSGIVLLILSVINNNKQSMSNAIFAIISVFAIVFGGYILLLSHREYKYFIKHDEVNKTNTPYKSRSFGAFLIISYFIYSPLTDNWVSGLVLLVIGLFVLVKVFIYSKI